MFINFSINFYSNQYIFGAEIDLKYLKKLKKDSIEKYMRF
jgi:hypothetical protein